MLSLFFLPYRFSMFFYGVDMFLATRDALVINLNGGSRFLFTSSSEVGPDVRDTTARCHLSWDTGRTSQRAKKPRSASPSIPDSAICNMKRPVTQLMNRWTTGFWSLDGPGHEGAMCNLPPARSSNKTRFPRRGNQQNVRCFRPLGFWCLSGTRGEASSQMRGSKFSWNLDEANESFMLGCQACVLCLVLPPFRH